MRGRRPGANLTPMGGGAVDGRAEEGEEETIAILRVAVADRDGRAPVTVTVTATAPARDRAAKARTDTPPRSTLPEAPTTPAADTPAVDTPLRPDTPARETAAADHPATAPQEPLSRKGRRAGRRRGTDHRVLEDGQPMNARGQVAFPGRSAAPPAGRLRPPPGARRTRRRKCAAAHATGSSQRVRARDPPAPSPPADSARRERRIPRDEAAPGLPSSTLSPARRLCRRERLRGGWLWRAVRAGDASGPPSRPGGRAGGQKAHVPHPGPQATAPLGRGTQVRKRRTRGRPSEGRRPGRAAGTASPLLHRRRRLRAASAGHGTRRASQPAPQPPHRHPSGSDACRFLAIHPPAPSRSGPDRAGEHVLGIRGWRRSSMDQTGTDPIGRRTDASAGEERENDRGRSECGAPAVSASRRRAGSKGDSGRRSWRRREVGGGTARAATKAGGGRRRSGWLATPAARADRRRRREGPLPWTRSRGTGSACAPASTAAKALARLRTPRAPPHGHASAEGHENPFAKAPREALRLARGPRSRPRRTG